MAVNKVTVNGNTVLDLTGDTVTAKTLKKGYTAHGANGDPILGTMEATSGGIVLSEETTVTPETLGKGITAYNNKGELITGTAIIKSSGRNTTWSPDDYEFVYSESTLKTYAYNYDNNITSWYLPNLTAMEQNSCNSMKKLTKVYAPALEKFSGSNLNFDSCGSLIEVVMPKLKEISLYGNAIYLFYDDCPNIQRFVIGTENGGTAVQVVDGTLPSTGYRFINDKVKIYVPDDLVTVYRGLSWLKDVDSSRIVGISTYPN